MVAIQLLLIEPDRLECEAIEQWVEHQVELFQCDCVSSITAAIAQLTSNTYDIVVLDIDSLESHPFELLTASKNQFIPLVVLAKLGAEDGVLNLMQQGAASYLIKDPDRNYLKLLPWTLHQALDRKQVGIALAQCEEQFQMTFDQAAVGICHVALDGQFLWFNARFCEICGYAAETLRSLTFQEITYPDDLPANLENTQNLLRGKIKTFTSEKRYIRQNREVVWASISVSLALGATNTPAYFIVIIQDITDRKRVEANLRASEKRYASLASAAPVGIFRTSMTGHCVYVNDRWCQITGLKQLQAIGNGWVEAIHPDDRDSVVQEWQAAIQEQRPFQMEYRFQRPDGSTCWVYGQAVGESNSRNLLTGVVGTITDICARKQAELALQRSEARSRAILTALPDLIIQYDKHGVYQEYLSNCPEMDLVPVGVDPIGRAAAELLPRDVAERSLYYLQKALETGEVEVYEQQVEIGDRLQDEEVRVVKCSNDEVLFVIRDITERKQAEKTFRSLMLGTATSTGQGFFPALVSHMAEALNVAYIVVSLTGDNPSRRVAA